MEEAHERYEVLGIQFYRGRNPTRIRGHCEAKRKLFPGSLEEQEPPANSQDAGWVRLAGG